MSSGRSVWRIAAALAVVATATVVALTTTFSGCTPGPPEPVDATKAGSVKVDAAVDSTTDGPLI
jgi:hypothetical protein